MAVYSNTKTSDFGGHGFRPCLPAGRLHAASYKLFAVILFTLSSIVARAQLPVPELWGTSVHDEAKVLKHETVDALENILKIHEDSTSNQLAILIIDSLKGEVLEEYSYKVSEAWKLGSQKNDNGALLFVSISDHAIRIEVGQGLEGVLTDAVCSRIIRNEIAPAFRRGDYDEGILEGTQAIVDVIKGEYIAEEVEVSETSGMSMATRLIMGIFIAIALYKFTWAAMIMKGGAGWGLYAFLILGYLTLPWIVVGVNVGMILLIVYIIVVPIFRIVTARSPKLQGKLKKWRQNSKAAGGRTWSSGSGYSGGGWSSGGSSFGRSSGGGFSGGGGSFRGGGASGGW